MAAGKERKEAVMKPIAPYSLFGRITLNDVLKYERRYQRRSAAIEAEQQKLERFDEQTDGADEPYHGPDAS